MANPAPGPWPSWKGVERARAAARDLARLGLFRRFFSPGFQGVLAHQSPRGASGARAHASAGPWVRPAANPPRKVDRGVTRPSRAGDSARKENARCRRAPTRAVRVHARGARDARDARRHFVCAMRSCARCTLGARSCARCAFGAIMRAVLAWPGGTSCARHRNDRLQRGSSQRTTLVRLQEPMDCSPWAQRSLTRQASRQCTACGRVRLWRGMCATARCVRRCTSGIAANVPRQTPRAHGLQSMGSKIAHAASVAPVRSIRSFAHTKMAKPDPPALAILKLASSARRTARWPNPPPRPWPS
jgi:hypothetical protein